MCSWQGKSFGTQRSICGRVFETILLCVLAYLFYSNVSGTPDSRANIHLAGPKPKHRMQSDVAMLPVFMPAYEMLLVFGFIFVKKECELHTGL